MRRGSWRGAAGVLGCVVVAVVSDGAVAQLPRIERLTEIGCEDCGDARQLASTWDVAVTESGDVMVVDRDAPTLRLFDRTGKPVWGRGRPGAGPGEYRYAMRAALGRDGVAQVVDMRLRRLTRLAADGSVAQSLPVPFFPAGVAVRRQAGELVFLTEDFKGGGTLQRWAQAADAPVKLAAFDTPLPGSDSFSPSVAVAPNGDVAYLSSADTYRIHRVSASGAALPEIVRDIPRPHMSAEEIAATQQRMGMVGGTAKASSEQTQSGGSKSVLPPARRLDLRPHVSADGLRYDDAGRLWVRTQRAVGRTTVFDIFGANGAFVGELTVPAKVESFALAGSYLATAGEREDGVPVVVLWSVR
ncbi:MAG TPA: hypothetical protein VM076_24925 [Gemmatimonadaceae bacterium]|nr:hypothetical protein [Gemmatimonadaceae bacterium]